MKLCIRAYVFFSLLLLQLPMHGFSYNRPAHVDPLVWNSMAPYFLPEDHPIKPKLDKLFSASRLVRNSKKLKKAGFKTPDPRPHSRTIVSRHPKLKGYWVKLYTDDQTDITDWVELRRRILGAHYTRESIERHSYQRIFKVPDKWIYPLPESPGVTGGSSRKNFILLAKDMRCLKKKENYRRWLMITPELLKAVHVVLHEAGLSDSVFAFNMPFGKDGRIAFIDTQHYHEWPVPFTKLCRYLSPVTRERWREYVHAQ